MRALYRILTAERLETMHMPALAGWVPQNAREMRVAILLLMVAILNGVDLAYTLFAHHIGWLKEMNPLAESFLALGMVPSLICYKLLMVLAGSTMLWRLRRSDWTVPACWVLVIAYAGLGVMWYVWVGDVMLALDAPLHWR